LGTVTAVYEGVNELARSWVRVFPSSQRRGRLRHQ